NGRLHFHAVHFMRTLPTGSVDPNFGRRVRNRRQLNSLQNTWPYGYSMPIADRKSGSAGMPRPISYAVFCLKKKKKMLSNTVQIGEPSKSHERRASGVSGSYDGLT